MCIALTNLVAKRVSLLINYSYYLYRRKKLVEPANCLLLFTYLIALCILIAFLLHLFRTYFNQMLFCCMLILG